MATNDELPRFAEPDIKIGAFNIQILGQTKMDKEPVVEVIIKILQRYAMTMIMEVRDSSQTVAKELVDLLNQAEPGTYSHIISKRLGRGSCKEQYLFVYRHAVIEPTGSYQYEDKDDAFERPPFTVSWKSKTNNLAVNEFATMCCHTKPDDVMKEVDKLHDVVQIAKKKLKTENIIISGDLNADGQYLSTKELKKTRLWSNKEYHWLIERHTDTTTGDSDCAYDHIIFNSRDLIDSLVPNSDTVYQFDVEMGISTELMMKVSDHYPIEFQLKGEANMSVQRSCSVSGPSLVIKRKRAPKVSDISAVSRKPRLCPGFTVRKLKEGSRISTIVARNRAKSSTAVMKALGRFSQTYPGTLNPELLSIANAHLGALDYEVYVPGALKGKAMGFIISIVLEIHPKPSCHLSIVREKS